MNDVANLSTFLQPEANQLDIMQTLFNFCICVLMAFILRQFYINRSYSLTGKLHIGSVIPILSAVVFTVIVIVKSSLALSLGLVGALSIVRFRTPIKEPEELIYLFLAISIGLGYGAGHALLTTILTASTLVIIYFWLSNRHGSKTQEYNLIINWENSDISFDGLSKDLMEMVESMSLVRLEHSPQQNTAVLLIEPDENTSLDKIVSDLQKQDPQISITFFEAKTNW